MSIDVCNDCSIHVDTDFKPEVYREEFDDTCLCDDCHDKRMDSEDMSDIIEKTDPSRYAKFLEFVKEMESRSGEDENDE